VAMMAMMEENIMVGYMMTIIGGAAARLRLRLKLVLKREDRNFSILGAAYHISASQL